MAKSEARRQKQLAKKKAKRDDKRAHLVRLNSDDPTIRLAGAEHWPIFEARVPVQLWERGMGQAVLSRRCPDGRLACGNFLIDAWCLGVKNAHWEIMAETAYDQMIRKIESAGGPMRKVVPEYLAKLVYAAADYAQSFGFPPHPDYRHARLLLVGIDAAQCQDIFEFGKDGKPFYFQGPHDSPAKVRSILQRLNNGVGHFMITLTGDMNDFQDFDEITSAHGPHVLEE
jgi:hypothetical protein